MNESNKGSSRQTMTDEKITLSEYSKPFTGIRNDLNALINIGKEILAQLVKHNERCLK